MAYFLNPAAQSWYADPSVFVPVVLGSALLALIIAGTVIFRPQRRIGQVRAEEQEILRHNRQLHFLNAISKVASQSFDIEEILRNAVEQLLGLFSADLGGVWLLDEDGHTLRRRSSTGLVRTDMDRLVIPDEFLAVVRERRMEFASERDLVHAPQPVVQLIESEKLRSLMCVLLWADGEPIGG